VVDGFDLGPAPGTDSAAKKPDPKDKAGKDKKPAEPEKKPLTPAEMAALNLAPRAIDDRIAYQIVSMLRDVVKRGTGTAAKVLGREDVGGKTGSTNDHRDAWFSGFGGPYVTTVWVGRDNYKSLGYREYGGKAALPIWIDYMRVALKDKPIQLNEPPQGMVKVSVAGNGQTDTRAAGSVGSDQLCQYERSRSAVRTSAMMKRSSSRVTPSNEIPICFRTALAAPSAPTTYDARICSSAPAQRIVAVTPPSSRSRAVSDEPYSTSTPNRDKARRRISSVRHCGIIQVSG
jgi:membrane carboxypeptidase/penicillin-binding protein